MEETYQIPSSSKFPFPLGILPDVGVGFRHDCDEDVHHQHPHDDLVDQPHDHSRRVREFQGEILILFSFLFDVDCFWIVGKERFPNCRDNQSPEGDQVFLHEGVVRCPVLLVCILEWLVH